MGFYIGKFYDNSTDMSIIKECCKILNYKKLVFDDEGYVIRKRLEFKQHYIGYNEYE